MTDFTDAPGATRPEVSTQPNGHTAELLVRTVSLGGSRLSRALQSSTTDDPVSSWIPVRPHTAEAWRARASAVRAMHATPDWFTELAPAFAATGAAAERLARSAHSGVVVTTGQQPGLFGGPAYTWTKAISALALADTLEREIGMPVAPVFWAATDDADWEEAAVTHILAAEGLQTLKLAGPPTDGVAMMDVPLGDVTGAMSALRAASGSAARASVLDELASAYVPHATVGAAYLQLLRSLLEPLGIAVVDASHPALRAAADPFLRRALTKAPVVAERLAGRTRAIATAGYAPQVDTIDTLSLVFQTRIGTSGRSRDRVRERIPVADASRVAREAEIGTLSANVLLRPVLERCLLPTVAYCAGPGEYAYFAQVVPVAEALGAEIPLPVPRWAGEVIESRSLRALERLAINETMLHDSNAAETLLARRAMPDGVLDALERLRVTLDVQTRALGMAIESADAVVAPEVSTGLARELLHRLDRFDRRVIAGVKRRESELMRQVAHLRAAFRPLGTSPERVLNLLPVLARYGTGVFDLMVAAAAEHARALVGEDDRADGAHPNRAHLASEQ